MELSILHVIFISIIYGHNCAPTADCTTDSIKFTTTSEKSIYWSKSKCNETIVYDVEQRNLSGICATQKAIEISRARRLEAIKADMLNKLKLDFAPSVYADINNFTQNEQLQKNFAELLQSTRDDESTEEDNDMDSYPQSQRIVAFANKNMSKEKSWQVLSNITLFFDLANNRQIDGRSALAKARLYFFVRRPPSWNTDTDTDTNQHSDFTVKVLTYLDDIECTTCKPEVHKQRPNKTFILPVTFTNGSDGTWLPFAATQKYVNSWQEYGNINHGFALQAGFFDGDNLIGENYVVFGHDPTESQQKPFLEIEVNERQRKTAASDQCNLDEKGSKMCCREEFEVDLNKAGFPFVITPKTINAYTCSGSCNNFYKPSALHTALRSFFHADDPLSVPPTCVPHKYGGLWMTYFDESQNLVSRWIHGIIIESCGCA